MSGDRLVVVSVEGADELIALLRRLGVRVDQVLEAAAQAGGQEFLDDANRRAPAPLLEMETTERKRGWATVDVGPPEEKWYWRFVETGAQPHTITGEPLVFEGESGLVVTGRVGHPGMAARPFLRPAFDGRQKQARDKTGGVIKREALARA